MKKIHFLLRHSEPYLPKGILSAISHNRSRYAVSVGVFFKKRQITLNINKKLIAEKPFME